MPTVPLHHTDLETIYEVEDASDSEDDSGNPSVRDGDSRRLRRDPDPPRPLSDGVSGARDRRPAPPSPPRPGRTPGARSRPARLPAPTGRAKTLALLADGERLLACGAFGAAGCIDVDL